MPIERDLIEAILCKEPTFTVDRYLFDQQRAFVNDPKPFKVAVCSRRAGKTVACAAHLLAVALATPDVICLYITLSRSNAKRIIWPTLLQIIRDHKIEAKINETDLSIRFKNNSILYCSGANDQTEIEKFRGLAIKLCYIDECQSFKPFIEDLIDRILAPALMDYAGSLCLIGTPGPIPAGYFHDCAVKHTHIWASYAWTFFDNPFIALKSGMSHQMLLERELERTGFQLSDAPIQREWFGKWVFDAESLLLRYEEAKNDYLTLPSAKWEYILGIDLGFVDADALAILAYSESVPETYLVDELVIAKQGLTELVQGVRQMTDKYPVSKMVIDEGGLGKKIAEEMRRRHQIPVQPADKARKMENIAFLNDALRTGRFKAKKKSRFAQDSYLLEIDRDKTTPEKIRVKETFHSDIIDAVLYAFKESPAYAYQPPLIEPKIYSPAWYQKEEDKMFEHTLEKAQQHQWMNQDDDIDRLFEWE